MRLLICLNPNGESSDSKPLMAADHLRKAKLLIVDDEPSNVRLLERILELNGFSNFRSTTDARQVLALCREYQPDLLLLDLNMPYMSGFTIMERMRAEYPVESLRPQVLVLTADITTETKHRAFISGARDFLTKPFDQSEAVLRIGNLVENRALSVQLHAQNTQLEILVKERTAQLENTLEQLKNTQDHVVKQERLRALGMMAGGIAHDFNNALTMVIGYGELLSPFLRDKAPPKEQEYLEHIVSAAQDAKHTVSRLREFYRPPEHNEVRDPVDINKIVEHTVSLTAPKWKARSQADGVQISVTFILGKIPLVLGNASALREILTNLIFNAVDAMPQGGSIMVRTHLDEGGVRLSVSDTGIGMTPEEKAQCLEPFYTTKGDSGTGLGLAVVYGIVQRHNGQIDVESTKGEGTTFTITLPPTDITEVKTEVAEVAASGALRILVVDDQDVICELLSEYLKSDGHDVVTAGDGQSALEVFRAGEFDLLMTDQSMPGMNGEQLAAAVHALRPGLPIILLTGFGDEMATRCSADISVVVGKPVTLADLRRGIATATAVKPV